MTETKQDNFEGGIATLSADPSDNFDENNPFKVSGVAIPVNTVLNGGQGVDHFYTEETLESAGDMLEGVNIVKNFHDIDGQANADQVIGEVTNAGFQKGVGLVWDGEITDTEIAEKVAHGYLDVSPSPMRSLGEFVEEMGAQRVDQLVGFRDIAVVANGQPGAEIQMGPNPAVEALSLDALSRGFDVLEQDTLKDVAGVSFTGTASGTLDESKIPNDDFESHYLYPGETKSESSYPVVDADGNLRRGNVESAWELGARGDIDGDEHDRKLIKLAQEFESVPEWAEQDANEPAESGADTPQNDDGENGSTPQSSAAGETTTTMSENDLSETEKAVLAAAGDVEDATDVLRSYATAEQPAIVEQDALEAKDERLEAKDKQLEEFAGVFRDALKNQKGLKEDTVEAMPIDALASEFRTEDGEIDVETLSQSPETQTTTNEENTSETNLDSLSADEKEAIKDKLKRADLFADRTPEHTDTLRSEAAEIAGVESADEIEVDAL